MGSFSDILATVQQGVTAANNLLKQMTGTLNNISGQFTAIQSSYVTSFNTRSSAVVPAQGDYPTNLIPGTNTNDSATAGNIGEYVSSIIASTSAFGVVSGAVTNLTSINLSAGDWDVNGLLGVLPTGTCTEFAGIISSQNGAFGDLTFAMVLQSTTLTPAVRQAFSIPTRRLSLAGSTTIYAVTQVTYGTSATIYGFLTARRPR